MKVISKKHNFDVIKRTNFINSWLVSITGLRTFWNSLNPAKNPKLFNL